MLDMLQVTYVSYLMTLKVETTLDTPVRSYYQKPCVQLKSRGKKFYLQL